MKCTKLKLSKRNGLAFLINVDRSLITRIVFFILCGSVYVCKISTFPTLQLSLSLIHGAVWLLFLFLSVCVAVQADAQTLLIHKYTKYTYIFRSIVLCQCIAYNLFQSSHRPSSSLARPRNPLVAISASASHHIGRFNCSAALSINASTHKHATVPLLQKSNINNALGLHIVHLTLCKWNRLWLRCGVYVCSTNVKIAWGAFGRQSRHSFFYCTVCCHKYYDRVFWASRRRLI